MMDFTQKNIKVSIIIATFNQAKYISDALDCVLNQAYNNWECIVIDDASTDNTKYICERYQKKDSRIKYIYHTVNQGVCVARNRAINQSSGKYVLCLDADDKISYEYVGLCVEELDKNPVVSLVTCNYIYFGYKHAKVVLEPYSLEKLMGHNLFVNCSMFRRADFDRVKGFNPNMRQGLEDWDFWLSILSQGGSVKYLSGYHFSYRITSNKESRNRKASKKDIFPILRRQIWLNHHDLYSTVYSSPYHSIEYIEVRQSIEYRLGHMILFPIRKIYNFISIFRNCFPL